MTKADFPYIGVTGFTSRQQVADVLQAAYDQNLKHRVMIGVLASSKTLSGRSNRYPGRYPPVEEIPRIFFRDSRALNLIHYSTDEPGTLYTQLAKLHRLAGPDFDGFQLNVTWPSAEAIETYRDHFGYDKYIVLQVGEEAMDIMEWSPYAIAESIGNYLPLIDYVLVDPSGGKGKKFSVKKVRRILEALEKRLPHLRLGVAGGFGPYHLDHLRDIAPRFPGISIDAEGKLRSPKPEDKLNVSAAREYLKKASAILVP